MKIAFKNKKYKKGFGILEVLVSAVIIIIILSSLVMIGNAAINNSVYMQQRAQATYLAQEGIEFVRQIRDTNWIDNSNTTQWDSLKWNGTSKVVADRSAIYKFDTARHLVPTSGTDHEDISINSVSYERVIQVESAGSMVPADSGDSSTDVNKTDNALKITATVTWGSKMGTKTVVVSEVLTNWRPNY